MKAVFTAVFILLLLPFLNAFAPSRGILITPLHSVANRPIRSHSLQPAFCLNKAMAPLLVDSAVVGVGAVIGAVCRYQIGNIGTSHIVVELSWSIPLVDLLLWNLSRNPPFVLMLPIFLPPTSNAENRRTPSLILLQRLAYGWD